MHWYNKTIVTYFQNILSSPQIKYFKAVAEPTSLDISECINKSEQDSMLPFTETGQVVNRFKIY